MEKTAPLHRGIEVDRSTIIDNIITGIIAGVSAGLILSAFSYVNQYIDHKLERREQIEYIRQIVEKFQEDILSVHQILSDPGAPSVLTEDPNAIHQLRWEIIEYTNEEVVKALDGRANTLTFDEKKQVRDAFGLYNIFRPGGDLGDRNLLLVEAQYHDIFDKLESIEWLEVRGADRTPLGPKP